MYKDLIRVLFMVSVFLFGLSLISFVVVEPGTGTFVVVVLNLIALGAMMLISGAVLRKCGPDTYRG